MRDYVRVYHPTASEEWANRRVSVQPTLISRGWALFTFTFLAGSMLGATITLMLGG